MVSAFPDAPTALVYTCTDTGGVAVASLAGKQSPSSQVHKIKGDGKYAWIWRR